jgi:hypothetical protein
MLEKRKGSFASQLSELESPGVAQSLIQPYALQQRCVGPRLHGHNVNVKLLRNREYAACKAQLYTSPLSFHTALAGF